MSWYYVQVMANVAVTVDPARACRSFESWFHPRAGTPWTLNKIRAVSNGTSDAKFFILLLWDKIETNCELLPLQSLVIYTCADVTHSNHKTDQYNKNWISKSHKFITFVVALTLEGNKKKPLNRQKPWKIYCFVRSPFVNCHHNFLFVCLRLVA